MAQFAVHRNTNAARSRNIPYLLDVQSALLDVLSTRVVVPLAEPEVLSGKSAQRLNPTFEVEGKRVVMLIPELAGIPTRLLGPQVMSLEPERNQLLAALDFLILGW